MTRIYPVLLAGGSGTRLWPLSRKSYPKQFSKLMGDHTLFQQSALRLTPSKIIDFMPPITLTNADFRFMISDQLEGVGIDPGAILIEPETKNTAPAILAASQFAHSIDENAVLLVAPSDHVIPDTDDFHQAIKVGLAHVQSHKIVTYGIKPTHPEIAYGYLELTTDAFDEYGTSDLKSFVEKPNLQNAKQMLEADHYLWNAGIFLFRAQDMINAFRALAPDALELVTQAVNQGSSDLGFFRLAAEPWSKLQEISIDYAIMEKAQNLVAVPYASKWSDLGDWASVWSESKPDSSGNVTSETAHAIECSNSLLRSESSGQQLVGIGLNDIMAIAMSDAVLIAPKGRAQDVKKVVEHLKAKDIAQAEIFPKDHRPWGWFESLALGDRFQVKRIYVKPGGSLSLQSHNHRSEHWIVVQGTAKVTIDGETKLITEGKSTYVPLGSIHRMENPGKLPMVLIEVQIGSYLGEDDIVRLEDVYSRS
ncbi:mannose-1-phosphate guanylyltransferase/mannose-6-phosphate isomerase [Planktomarina sp.]|nr:mannose-1-phosphate guanylyltransferase/mannose-6-phosphate isomerase [Planktomarina sp.]